MKKNIRKVTAVLLGLLGTILAIYVGGYWLFIRPFPLCWIYGRNIDKEIPIDLHYQDISCIYGRRRYLVYL